jgi:hypothetical protein
VVSKAAWRYFELEAVDGPPLAYYRYNGTQSDIWDGESWQPSKNFLRKWTQGEPMLEEVESDPTVALKQSEWERPRVALLARPERPGLADGPGPA